MEHFCVQTCADIMEHLPSKSNFYMQQYILNVGYRIATVEIMANEVARLQCHLCDFFRELENGKKISSFILSHAPFHDPMQMKRPFGSAQCTVKKQAWR
jgi:hypothetical protein